MRIGLVAVVPVVVVVVIVVVAIAWRVEAGDGKSVDDRVSSLEQAVSRLEKRVATVEEQLLARPAPSPARVDKRVFQAVEIQIDAFKEAIDLYRLENRTLPASLEELTRPSRRSGEPFLAESRLPVDPWGTSYDYHVTNATKGEYTITSYGDDKQSGTADDIVCSASGGFK